MRQTRNLSCARWPKGHELRLNFTAANHAKIVRGVAVIDLAQNDAALREKIETHLQQFYAQSPGRLDAALNALTLTVTKPESEAWKENV